MPLRLNSKNTPTLLLILKLSCTLLLPLAVSGQDNVFIDTPFESPFLRLDQEENIFLVDEKQKKLCLLLKEGNYDSTYCSGGNLGRSVESFLDISQLQISQRSLLYLFDQARQVIFLLSKELNLLQSIEINNFLQQGLKQDYSQNIIVKDFLVDPSGAFIFLNEINNNVYRFSPQGRFINQFGGLGKGEASLKDPVAIYLYQNGRQIWVWDQSLEVFQTYDPWGNYLGAKEIDTITQPRKIKEDQFYSLNGDKLIIYSLALDKKILEWPLGELLEDMPLKDVQISQQFLYLLSQKGILRYPRYQN